MNLLKLFASTAPNSVFFAIAAGAVAGIGYGLLIPIILSALSPPGTGLTVDGGQDFHILGLYIAQPKFAAAFLGLCFLILILRTISQVLLTRIGIDLTCKLRQTLYRRISSTSISSLERIGQGRLIQAMTEDTQHIVNGASTIPGLLIQFFTLIGLLGYLCYINHRVFSFVVLMIIIGAFSFQIPVIIGARYLARSRWGMDDLQDGFSGLIDGAKELKLNREKSENFIRAQLLSNENKVNNAEKKGLTIIQIATNYGDMITFFVMGAITFIFINYNSLSLLDLTGVIMVLLYITGPVAFILNTFPIVSRARISLNKIQVLFDNLPAENVTPLILPVSDWNSMNLRSVCYKYTAPETKSNSNEFCIGPINIKIKRGQITFIVGGNGSGKSTLAKIISLHYFPELGEVAFDDAVVTSETLNSYRQEIACIYTDYYLFKEVHSSNSENGLLGNQVDDYLKRLELKGKVEFLDGKFTTLKLSDGQRRRLALLVAFLDDKRLYIFDEWAADQDPNFKEVFYFEILPSLKKQGKAVVAISHDDRYFGIADQIIHMEDGVIRSEPSMKKVLNSNARDTSYT